MTELVIWLSNNNFTIKFWRITTENDEAEREDRELAIRQQRDIEAAGTIGIGPLLDVFL